MGERKNRQFMAKEKVAILREHLLEKQEISKVCEKHQIAPRLFYYWQRQFFENGEAAFSPEGSGSSEPRRQLERKVEALEGRLAKKDTAIAEVTEEFVKLKKELGEP